jgi:HAD superfamily hydrolase (TIGR01509 family)
MQPTPPINAIIFDCDGTLVDSETLSLAVLIEHVAEFGLIITHSEAMERFAGNELSVVFSEFERRLGRKLPDDFLDNFRSRQCDVLKKQLLPVPGVHDLLDAITLPFCVASNAPLSKVNVCLETVELIHHFQPHRIFSAYQINAWKPAPDLFLMAAESLGVAPQNCAVVEDSIFGIKAGLAAGMQVFAFDPHEKLPRDLGAVHFVRQIQELRPLLSSH